MRGRSSRLTRGMLPYILISPLVVFIGALSFVPTADTTVEAFFRVMPLDPPEWGRTAACGIRGTRVRIRSCRRR